MGKPSKQQSAGAPEPAVDCQAGIASLVVCKDKISCWELCIQAFRNSKSDHRWLWCRSKTEEKAGNQSRSASPGEQCLYCTWNSDSIDSTNISIVASIQQRNPPLLWFSNGRVPIFTGKWKVWKHLKRSFQCAQGGRIYDSENGTTCHQVSFSFLYYIFVLKLCLAAYPRC